MMNINLVTFQGQFIKNDKLKYSNEFWISVFRENSQSKKRVYEVKDQVVKIIDK